MKALKVALVHDYLREYGGAERVLEVLHEMYPDAPVYTAFVDEQALGIHWKRFANWDIRQSVASRIPLIKKLYSPLRVLSAFFFEGFDFSDYDVVISSTNMYMAKAVITRPETLHISYIHTPPRSLYGLTTMTDWKKSPMIRVLGELINFRMRQIDFLTAQRPNILVANSKVVQERIKKYYKRDSIVIYPPVSIQGKGERVKGKEEYYLYVGRMAKSKHADLAIQACVQLGRKLKMVGTGKGEMYLHAIADDHIEFLGSVSDEKLADLYAGAIALIFPAEDEDFGIVPVEAMMAGTPVISHRSGGPTETIVEGKTGVFFKELTLESVKEAIELSEKKNFDPVKIAEHARQFSVQVFQGKIHDLIAQALKDHY